jgi:uncharacterized membrane protein
VAILGVVALATVVALVALWPRGDRAASTFGSSAQTEQATVVEVALGGCRSGGGTTCRRVTVRLDSGAGRGTRSGLDIGTGFDIDPGDTVRVVDTQVPGDAVVGGQPADRYSFSDFERRQPLVILSIVFAALVLLAARWRGLRALFGLAISLGVVVWFVVPGILEGTSAIAIALVGSLAILLVAVPLAHGLSPKAVAATLGTAAALILTLILAEIATGLANITGFGSDEANFLQASSGQVSIRGLLLAGIVIGSLGVLDDLTITQSSAVMALRAANPRLTARQLFSGALRIGQDHIVAVVNTLVLAYVGASLPTLLVFSLADVSFSDALNTEAVASQVVSTMVGSIGLIAAVPLTTALAALLASRIPASQIAAQEGHHHH